MVKAWETGDNLFQVSLTDKELICLKSDAEKWDILIGKVLEDIIKAGFDELFCGKT